MALVTQPQIGKHFQDVAEAYLREQGFTLIERNFRCTFGEIDLVMQQERTLVFVEVKSRGSNRRGTASEAVTPAKQRQLSRVALLYLKKHGGFSQSARFDVVAVDHTDDTPQLRWHRSAFELQYG